MIFFINFFSNNSIYSLDGNSLDGYCSFDVKTKGQKQSSKPSKEQPSGPSKEQPSKPPNEQPSKLSKEQPSKPFKKQPSKERKTPLAETGCLGNTWGFFTDCLGIQYFGSP